MLVVGAGLAGLSAARAARELGFGGPLTVVGGEIHRPYDRPPLSKDYLAGTASRVDIDLQAEGEDLRVDWVQDTAVSLDLGRRAITTATGSSYAADGIVLATGSSARMVPGLGEGRPENVLTLRTIEDADRLRSHLTPLAPRNRPTRLVVLGAGLIGSEVASTAAALGCQVTVVDREAQPLLRLYGPDLGPRLEALPARSGVTVIADAAISSVETSSGQLVSVTLADGRSLPLDVLLVAVGAAPETAWLVGSGLDLADGISCDAQGRALSDGQPVDGVVAVGDCAGWWDHHLLRHHRAQHWTDALERPALAVASLLGVPAPRRRPYLPYFWSDQHGVRIQMAGYASLADDVRLEVDDPETAQLVAVYRRQGEPVAVLAVSRPREFTRWRKVLTTTLGHVPDQPTFASAVAAPAAAGPTPRHLTTSSKELS
ncbi:MAG TPA: FAD-dependent oxidoreductase [Propionibacteriaceae bacterium]